MINGYFESFVELCLSKFSDWRFYGILTIGFLLNILFLKIYYKFGREENEPEILMNNRDIILKSLKLLLGGIPFYLILSFISGI